ncbi:unnamed protein product [Closterium sp. Yama58-4]|nr:unnamed protein product [Closterium sp. Yama58-4]
MQNDPARVLELRGMHVSNAVCLLQQEVAALRFAAQRTKSRQQLYVRVGSGLYTSDRALQHMPAVVEQYLVDQEGLHVLEPQPGLLRVFM